MIPGSPRESLQVGGMTLVLEAGAPLFSDTLMKNSRKALSPFKKKRKLVHTHMLPICRCFVS